MRFLYVPGTIALAELERTFGRARRIPLGPLHDKLTEQVPGGWRPDGILVDVGRCPHCAAHPIVYAVFPDGVTERVL